MLELRGLYASYGVVKVLEDVSLRITEDQVVCLLGANGAGKTTTLNCISGLVGVTRGTIEFRGERISGLATDQIVARGIVQVPEGREIFAHLTVTDNLLLGGWLWRRQATLRSDLERVYGLFPRLHERREQPAGTLSGGEQQMLMIGRALMSRPKLLLLDEPSLGLSPILIETVFDIIGRVHREGLPILLVEQNARVALGVSDYCYVMENGEIRLQGTSAQMVNNPEVRAAYLGTS